ncbi:MAG: rhodanese-like domain-containing protein [Candidatus Parcubacteria bacterium]|nr:rhodanese-like domain-containing protein [Leptolyngbyaceae cyanobacterium LF-bin-113]
MMGLEDIIKNVKEALPNITPTPPGLKRESSVYDLKSRLEWGEPALTILDVRPRELFNDSHVMGAMDFPLTELVTLAKGSLEPERDIYLYGANDQETAQAAATLREAGFRSVAELKGGLTEWKAVGGSTEGTVDAREEPGEHAYNVVSQVKHHMDTQKIDFE